MIKLWRGKWHQPDMPFLIVQLPKFGIDAIEDGGWPLIREQEWRVADELEHVAAVVTLDAGESNDLHPHDKKTMRIVHSMSRWILCMASRLSLSRLLKPQRRTMDC